MVPSFLCAGLLYAAVYRATLLAWAAVTVSRGFHRSHDAFHAGLNLHHTRCRPPPRGHGVLLRVGVWYAGVSCCAAFANKPADMRVRVKLRPRLTYLRRHSYHPSP